MRRWSGPIVAAAGLFVLFVVCFHGVLFRGRAFVFRDAGHFYRPLDQYVARQWSAGLLPLWEPEENGGMPLLGNPSAAVLYPGKAIFALLPFESAEVAYTLIHLAIACLGMYRLSRFWRIGPVGSSVAAYSFAFGGPVLFQYGNIIFLVGAAWIPWGVLAAERLRKNPSFAAIAATSIVLALQILGGDPQAAYLTAVGATVRAWLIGKGVEAKKNRRQPGRIRLKIFLTVSIWIATVLAGAAAIPWLRLRLGASPDDWTWLSGRKTAAIAWVPFAAIALIRAVRRGRAKPRFGPILGILSACLLSASLASVQLVPSLEFARLTARAADVGPHDVYPFSLEPYRVVEWIFPNVFGESIASNRSWLETLPPIGRHKIWVPSLYMGMLPFLSAISAVRFRNGASRRFWLTLIASASLLGSLGEFAGPIRYARQTRFGVERFGPIDDPEAPPIRLDGFLRDGDGSPYWLLTALLPGFGSFRYPSKLLVWTNFALAALAGFGWDLARRRHRRAIGRAAAVLAAIAAAFFLALVGFRHAWIKILAARPVGPSIFGRFEVDKCLDMTRNSFLHSTMIATSIYLAFRLRGRRPFLAGPLALAIVAVDLAAANSWMIVTAPRELFSKTPKLVERIRAAERGRRDPGPFRIHRMIPWHPIGWPKADRSREFVDVVAWERDTLMPKYGIPYGISYAFAEGTAELYDYEWFFAPLALPKRMAEAFHPKPGETLVWYPRPGFDLWNTRYFLIPAVRFRNLVGRSTAAFLSRVEIVAPTVEDFRDRNEATRFHRLILGKATAAPGDSSESRRFLEDQDWVLVRNRDAYPRAWAVHSAKVFRPIVGLDRRERSRRMEGMIFPRDDRPPPDFREVAWIETFDDRPFAPFLPGDPSDPADLVDIESYQPRRVSIRTVLRKPGIVVLADIFYPGWRLSIDGEPAEVFRTNRAMRGAIVPGGTHRLVYEYRPDSLRLGTACSIVGVVVLLGLLLFPRFASVVFKKKEKIR